jgi:transketolase
MSFPFGNVDTVDLAIAIRGHALRMVHRANASHIGTCLSMADQPAVLYGRVLRVDTGRPDWPERKYMECLLLHSERRDLEQFS